MAILDSMFETRELQVVRWLNHDRGDVRMPPTVPP
jgi:hypothetical protein